MSITSQIRMIRKVLFRGKRIIFIDLKSSDIITKREGGYLYSEIEAGFAGRLDAFRSLIDEIRHLMFCPEIESGRAFKGLSAPPLNNGQFAGSDARIGYGLVRRLRPERVIEIGSGYSTHFFRRAVADEDIPTRIVCIDPAPRVDVEAAADEVHRVSVLEADPRLFESLSPNDIVFLDGSHYAFNGTDVPHFFLNILPVIPKGVYVHVHDIMLPYEYDETFSERHYNEQYLLGALLANSRSWVPVLPVYYLHRTMPDVLPEFGTSFWMTRA